jgi:hypothetical protein
MSSDIYRTGSLSGGASFIREGPSSNLGRGTEITQHCMTKDYELYVMNL